MSWIAGRLSDDAVARQVVEATGAESEVAVRGTGPVECGAVAEPADIAAVWK